MGGHFVFGWLLAKKELQNGSLGIALVEEGVKTIAGCTANGGAKSALPSVWVEINKTIHCRETFIER